MTGEKKGGWRRDGLPRPKGLAMTRGRSGLPRPKGLAMTIGKMSAIWGREKSELKLLTMREKFIRF